MNFLVIGSGAREHIMAQKLFEAGAKVFSILTNSNPGLIQLSKDYLLVDNYTQKNIDKIVDYGTAHSIDLSLIHISEPTDQRGSRMPSSA